LILAAFPHVARVFSLSEDIASRPCKSMKVGVKLQGLAKEMAKRGAGVFGVSIAGD
jgi:hypothetical protein